MRSKRMLVLIAVLALGAAIMAATALGVNWITSCQSSHTNFDDPIVYPNQPGASHEHLFVGARTTNAYSTFGSLVASQTTCVMQGDRSGYWIPKPNYPIHRNLGALFYYTGSPNVRPFPEGFKMLVGNSKATSEADNPAIAQGRMKWKCGPGSGAETNAPPPKCDSGMLVSVIEMPNYWNGRDLYLPGNAHMSYSKSAAFPIELPRIKAYIRFAVPAGQPINLTLASGPYYTMHLDFMNGWVTSELQRFIDMCMKTKKNCGKNPA